MGGTLRCVLSVVVVASVLAGSGVGTAAEEGSPTVTVRVDGTTLADGESTLTESDPRVRVSVDANASIGVVAVRVDGETRRRYAPNDTTFATSFVLELDSGEHTLTVVAEAGAVTTREVTVLKDVARPYVRYTTPFETEQYAPPPANPTVNRTDVTLAGNFTDVTGVGQVRIVRQTTYTVGSRERRDRDVYHVKGPGDSFAQPIFLGVGHNNITAEYTDDLGHRRIHRFVITVEDTAPPTLAGLSVVRTGPAELRIRGRATDNGQLSSVSVRSANDSDRTLLLGPTIPKPDPSRQRHAFQTTVSLSPGTTRVVVNATDTAGNSARRTVSVRRTVEPDLVIDRGTTRYVDDGTLLVAGRATDGEVVAASVETVDPESGEVVDIVLLHDGDITTDLSFQRRLDASPGNRTVVRLRVTDSAGEEHVASLTRTPPVETATRTATPTPTPAPTPGPNATATSTPTPTPTPGPNATATTAESEPASAGISVPLLGVTVPVPALLGTSVSLPVPVVGPFDLPLAPVALVALVGAGVVARRR